MGGRRRARLVVVRDVAVLVVTLLAVVGFLVVGGTLVWALTEAEASCRENAVPPLRPADEVNTAGWSWDPPGMRCVVSRGDGSADRLVVTPW
ncbi:MAG: hypothetical protein ACRDYU_14610 [Actinomycetes bacterium]